MKVNFPGYLLTFPHNPAFPLRSVYELTPLQVTIYNDVDNCDAGDDTMYRVIEGAATGGNGPDVGTCYTFDEGMPGTACAQFTRGGWEGPNGCDSSSLVPKSVIVRNQNRPCYFYNSPGCTGPGRYQDDGCITASEEGWDRFRSFRCDVSSPRWPYTRSCHEQSKAYRILTKC